MEDKKYVITVAREFGSLGRPIAQKAAQVLGIEYYDRDLVEMSAAAMKVDADGLSLHDEQRYGRFERMIYPMGASYNPVDQKRLFEVQKSIILDLAANKRPCIIVGRCADYILENKDNTLHVFIYSSYEKRLENCINEFHMGIREAKKMIAKIDKARSSYYSFYTDRDFNTLQGRDLMIDSGVYGVDGAVALIKTAVEQKFGPLEE
ncbi:MAG: cytidylate kinase-like family protein [Lachnospiraceae bacterium]|nr:cytidylate kinase-like family protein [Lachnospiraceae bacterium]